MHHHDIFVPEKEIVREMDEDKDFVVVTVSGDDRPGILEGIPLDQTVAIGDGPTMPSCSVRRGWELPTMPGRSSTGLLLGIS
jgi:hypothetical protein